MTKSTPLYKTLFLSAALSGLVACSVNEATGERQFTPFMPAASEAQIGAQEHQKILAEYGGQVQNQQLQNYVNQVGQKLVPTTERGDVTYTFTVLDSPIMNAFALPGGYVYITRGILSIMENEAQLAAILGHEMGHVTARHSAQRYSTSVLAGLGASVISAAVNTPGVDQALGLGANLYLSSYSRSQESQADSLGVRYIARSGYDPLAMSNVHENLQAFENLQAREAGREGANEQFNYFSTHPITSQRIVDSANEARQYPANNNVNRDSFMNAMDGMIYGDSPKQGFMNGNTFVHPDLGFQFNVPAGYATENTPQQFIAVSRRQNGPILLFSGAQKNPSQNVSDFLVANVLKGNAAVGRDLTTTTVNGMPAATVEVQGQANGTNATIRIVAIEWNPQSVYLFQLAFPAGTSTAEMGALKDSAFSLRKVSASEAASFAPKRIDVFTAVTGDSVASRASRMPYNDGLNDYRFRVINGLGQNENLTPGVKYKTIVQ